MNAFDYWFDYIVRNGEFVDGFWRIVIDSYYYGAIFGGSSEQWIVIKSLLPRDSERARYVFYKSSFDCYDEMFKPLAKTKRKII